MRAPKDSSSPSAKQKTLSIHISTDHTGPNDMPLVYGSTPDRIGTIKGTVKFFTNYDCRGRDIVILYEAKAEAQWTALENKKIVDHRTEEILGHHIWHFPLDHTKPGGHTVVAGTYEKEFEVSLVHPSILNRASTLPLSPPSATLLSSIPSGMSINGPTTLLLPSSSNSPNAKMKYTIRAILRRPFPSISNIEASQEVWVLQSCLPPAPPAAPPALPKSSVAALPPRSPASTATLDHCGSRMDPSIHAPATSTLVSTNHPLHPTTTPPTSSSTSKLADGQEHFPPSAPPASSRPLISLAMPTKVIKSAFSMLPTIDLSRPKQLLTLTLPSVTLPLPSDTTPSKPIPTAIEKNEQVPEVQQPAMAASSIISPSQHAPNSLSAVSESSSLSSASSERSSHSFLSNNQSSSENDDDDDPANYTGVWEPFKIPYSCSFASETVYLGQTVPLTIRFGPSERDRSRKNRKDRGRRRHAKHGHKQPDQEQEEEPSAETAPAPRFVIKKGILKVVEHTLLREVTITPMPTKFLLQPQKQKDKHSNSMTRTSPPISAIKSSRHSQETPPLSPKQQPLDQLSTFDHAHGRSVDYSSGGLLIIPDFAKAHQPQSIQAPFYKEKGYSSSHSHLHDLLQHELQHSKSPSNKEPSTQRQQQQPEYLRNDYNDTTKKRFFFKPKRHSLDYSLQQHTPTPPLSPSPSHELPAKPSHGLPPSIPSSANTRITNSIEAKFKTEVMAFSLTPQLQQRERQYQRILRRKYKLGRAGQDDGSQGVDMENSDEDSDEDNNPNIFSTGQDLSGEIEVGVWQTSICVKLPGPAELATCTETKHIVKKHTLQLILLCGLVGGEDTKETLSGATRGAGSASVLSSPDSIITQPGVNKEFRLEMDIYVTGPRAPDNSE